MNLFLMPMVAPFISKTTMLIMVAVSPLHYLFFGKSLFASR